MPLADTPVAHVGGDQSAPTGSRRRVPRTYVVAVLAIGIVGVIQSLMVEPAVPRPPFFDEQRYRLYADNLVNRGFFGDEAGAWPATAEFRTVDYAAYVPPGYVFFLAPFRAVFGTDMTPVRIAQALLVGLAIVAASFLAERVFGPVAGIVAGMVLVATGVMAAYSSFSLSEVAAATTLVMSVWLALIARDRRSWLWLGASGAVLGVSILVRPQVLLLPPAIVAWTWIAWGHNKHALRAAGIYAAGLVLVVAPWTVRNFVRLDAFVPVSTYTWINFWLVNHEGSDGTFQRPESDIGVEEVARIRALPEVAQDGEWRRMALAWIRENPGDAVRGWVRNGKRYVSDPDHLMQRWYALAGKGVPRLDDRWLFAVATAALAATAFGRTFRAGTILLGIVLLYFLAFFCLFVPTPRFRVGMLPVLAALAAGLAQQAWTAAMRVWARMRPAPA